jgi:hypothetical protein
METATPDATAGHPSAIDALRTRLEELEASGLLGGRSLVTSENLSGNTVTLRDGTAQSPVGLADETLFSLLLTDAAAPGRNLVRSNTILTVGDGSMEIVLIKRISINLLGNLLKETLTGVVSPTHGRLVRDGGAGSNGNGRLGEDSVESNIMEEITELRNRELNGASESGGTRAGADLVILKANSSEGLEVGVGEKNVSLLNIK